MSDKDRRKKEGKEKNKNNQARRKAEANPEQKREQSANDRFTDTKSRPLDVEDSFEQTSTPPVRRAGAAKGRGR